MSAQKNISKPTSVGFLMQKISIHPTETCIKSNFGTAYYEILF